MSGFGIRLGNFSSSVSKVNEQGVPEIISDVMDGSDVVPSSVYFSEDGSVIVGENAVGEGTAFPERLATNFISKLSTKTTDETMFITVDGREYFPIELTAILIRRLVHNATLVGENVKSIVVSCKACDGYDVVEAIHHAAEAAGVEVDAIVPEAFAAVVGYLYSFSQVEDKNILAFDLGGTSLACSLIELNMRDEERALQCIAEAVKHSFGGDDWNGVLYDIVCEKIRDEYGLDVEYEEELVQKVKAAIENLKKRLSHKTLARIKIAYNGELIRLEFTREEFEERAQLLLEETENFLDEFLKKANYCSKSAIDLVIVTGNAARLPMIQTLLTDRFGENVAFCLGDFVVEKGLALIASVLNDTTCGSYWSVDAAIQKILSEKEYKEDSKKSDSLKYVLSGVQGSCYNKRLKAYVEKTGFRIVLETYSDTWDHVVSETELYSSDTCFSSEQLHERICQAYLDRMLLSMKLSYTDITEEMTAAAVQYADCVLARGAQFVSYDAINFRENWIVPLQDAYDFVDVSIALHLPIDDLVNKILIPLNAVIGKLHQDSCRFEVDIVGDFPCAGLLEKAFTDKKLYLAACEDIVFCMLDVSAVSIRLIGTDIGMPYSSCMKDRSEWSHTSIWEDVYAEILEEKQYLCQVYGNSLPDIKLKRRNMQNYLEEMFEKNSVTIEGVEITVDDFIIHSRKHLQMLSDKIQELSKQNPSSKIVVTGDMLKLQSIRHMFEHDFHDKVIIKSLDELNEIGQNFVNRKRVVNELQKMYLI